MTDTPMIDLRSSTFLNDKRWFVIQRPHSLDLSADEPSTDTTNVDPKRPTSKRTEQISSQVHKYIQAATVTMALSAYQAQTDDLSTAPIKVPEHPSWLAGPSLSAQAAVSDLDELFPPATFSWSVDRYVAERAARSYCEDGDADS